MKVILTEEQLRQVIQEEVNEAKLINSLLGLNDPNKFVKRIVLALLLGTIGLGSLPGIINTVAKNNPAIENVGENKLFDRIKSIFTNIKNKGAQVTGQMETDAKRQATDISQNAISQICKWETRKDFGYRMQPKDLQGYYLKGEKIKTYGYGLRVHPNGKYMQDIKAVWTQPELEKLFKEKIEKEKAWVLNWANKNNVTLGQGQLDAMVSAVYNYGRTGFLKTGVPALIAQNPNNPAIPEKWAHLSDARAKKFPGLATRRAEEANWYQTDISQNA